MKVTNTVEYTIRQGWPLLLGYDMECFGVTRIYLAEHSGLSRYRIDQIIQDKEASMEELDAITIAFNRWINKISEL